MMVELVKDNPDGSGNFVFTLTEEDKECLLRYGILEALKAAVREGEKLKWEGEE
jgi:hypothetical protein